MEEKIKQNNEPHACAAPLIHEKALELLTPAKRGKILDAPAGEGYASKRLKAMGFEVYAVDLDEKEFKLKDVRFEKADLNRPLPYPDAFFDYILCLEGIEHLENPHHLIREFWRVLTTDGQLILSTPNVLSVYGRLRYFLSGYADWIHARINLPEAQKAFSLLQQHINLIGFPELYFILTGHGFKIENVLSNRSCLAHPAGKVYLKPLVWLVLVLATLMIKCYGGVFKRKVILSKFLLNHEVLYGEALIVQAIKSLSP